MITQAESFRPMLEWMGLPSTPPASARARDRRGGFCECLRDRDPVALRWRASRGIGGRGRHVRPRRLDDDVGNGLLGRAVADGGLDGGCGWFSVRVRGFATNPIPGSCDQPSVAYIAAEIDSDGWSRTPLAGVAYTELSTDCDDGMGRAGPLETRRVPPLQCLVKLRAMRKTRPTTNSLPLQHRARV